VRQIDYAEIHFMKFSDPERGHRSEARGGGGRLTAALAVMILGMLLLSGCRPPFGPGADKNKKAGGDDKPVMVTVGVSEIRRGRLDRIVKASTDLQAEASVRVFARTSNFVKELLVEEGDVIREGDLMVRLVDDIQKTQFEKAKVNEERARLEYERQEKLYRDQIISDQEFKNAELDYRQQKLLLEEAERELEFTRIVAPINGTVTQRLINLGDNVSVNQHLFDLVDFQSIKAPVFLPEAELTHLETGQVARVMSPALGDVVFEGFVERISPTVDSRSGTVEVLIGFRDVDRLRPGMYVNVEIVTATRMDALLVPREALLYDADQIFVFRLVKGLDYPERKVERILIDPAMEDKDFIEPVSGIEEGDSLVVIGKAGLRPDSLVRLPGDPQELPGAKDEKNGKNP
jgi:membrane fusion protein (multidrug efflux system)